MTNTIQHHDSRHHRYHQHLPLLTSRLLQMFFHIASFASIASLLHYRYLTLLYSTFPHVLVHYSYTKHHQISSFSFTLYLMHTLALRATHTFTKHQTTPTSLHPSHIQRLRGFAPSITPNPLPRTSQSTSPPRASHTTRPTQLTFRKLFEFATRDDANRCDQFKDAPTFCGFDKLTCCWVS